jgi:hypothetical protein
MSMLSLDLRAESLEANSEPVGLGACLALDSGLWALDF